MFDFAMDEDRRQLDAVMNVMSSHIEEAGDTAGGSLLPKEALEGIYSLAHSAYGVENYAEAESLFMGMIMFAASDSRGWLGYAGACEAQKKWAQAVEGYAGALDLLPGDPVAPYRAGVCLMAMDAPEEARQAFANRRRLQGRGEGRPQTSPLCVARRIHAASPRGRPGLGTGPSGRTLQTRYRRTPCPTLGIDTSQLISKFTHQRKPV